MLGTENAVPQLFKIILKDICLLFSRKLSTAIKTREKMFLYSMDPCQKLIKAEKISIYIGALTAWKYDEISLDFK